MTKGNTERQRRWHIQRTPYPFVYSRDAWDIRRFNPLGQNPSGGVSRWGVRFAVALIVIVLGGSLLLLIMQAAQAIFH